MTREQVLKGVLRNYARFYISKTFFSYPWIRDRFKRRYMLGCLKAFAKTTATKKFYDLERLKFNGMSAQVDLGFDETKVLERDRIIALKRDRPELSADIDFKGTPIKVLAREAAPIKVLACGGGPDASDDDVAAAIAAAEAGVPGELAHREVARPRAPAVAPS
jgi:anaerobic magnesium-protoporphyrin IX monomethyl ester cyclase